MKCIEACPSEALKLWGELMTVDEMMKIISEDKSYYIKTGGGVTLSGGEVMLQWEIAEMLLKACKNSAINTVSNRRSTVRASIWRAVYRLYRSRDYRHKAYDTKKHREYTGAGMNLFCGTSKEPSSLIIACHTDARRSGLQRRS